jgi:hypothetical protein
MENSGRFVLSNMVDRKSGAILGTLLCDVSPVARQSEFPWLAYLTYRYKNRPLPSQAEFDSFEQVERGIESLEEASVIAWVGTMTHNGVRDFIVYCRDKKDAKRRIIPAMGEMKPRIKFAHDPGWSQHKDLLDMLNHGS